MSKGVCVFGGCGGGTKSPSMNRFFQIERQIIKHGRADMSGLNLVVSSGLQPINFAVLMSTLKTLDTLTQFLSYVNIY